MEDQETNALVERSDADPGPVVPMVLCPECDASVGDTPEYVQLRICLACGHHFPE